MTIYVIVSCCKVPLLTLLVQKHFECLRRIPSYPYAIEILIIIIIVWMVSLNVNLSLPNCR